MSKKGWSFYPVEPERIERNVKMPTVSLPKGLFKIPEIKKEEK